MKLFLSTYINKIDKKSRVSVPAAYRLAANTGDGFSGIIAYPSFVNNCIEACSMERIVKISNSIETLDVFSEEKDAFATTILASCVQLAFDPEGRIVLTEDLMKFARLEEQAVFVGKGTSFEIWNPKDFDTYMCKAKEIARENRVKLRLI